MNGAEPWSVRLLGAIEMTRGGERIDRFPSRAVALLLARLALAPERLHPREELVELLWPGVDLAVGRNRLRQALSTLKSLVERPGAPPLLPADRMGVRVAAGALQTDVGRFEAYLRAGRSAEAAACWRGDLLPGHYDAWIADERLRLAALADRMQAAAPARAAAPVERASPLPAYATRVFGQQAQAARLVLLLRDNRLVTLTGPGGSGKTRLAVEAAQRARDAAAFDHIAFVPLAAHDDAAALPDALLQALRLKAGAGAAVDRLAQSLAGRRALLVLDNLEQLLPQAAATVAALLAALPRLHLLVTSRRLAAVDGEQEFRVAPLALPADGAALDDVAASPAVALFVDRARAARSTFALDHHNAAAVAALVRVLDGMPLAIELAASRVRSVAPAEMLQRLRAGDSALLARADAAAAVDPRHASMQRVVAWSWQQLDPAQAALLAALTVFEGSFTAAAAAAVAGQGDVVLALDALLSHSLLQSHDQRDGTLRFALYGPVRDYAAATLAAAQRAVLRQRHRDWWPRWAAGFGATPPLAAVRAELPNIDAALRSALDDGDADAALVIVLALRGALNDVALPAASLQHVAAALQRCRDPALAGCGHTLLGTLSFDAGRHEAALVHVELGLALAPPGSPQRARALHAAASVRWRSERDAARAEPLLDEAEALARDAGDRDVLASVLALRAYVANVGARDHARGEALHRQALALWEAIGNAHAVNGGIYNLAVCARNARRWTEALLRLEAVCANARDADDRQQQASALNLRGEVLCALRDWPRAWTAYRECIAVAWAAAEPLALAYGLWNAPRVLAHRRRPLAAARLMGFVEGHWQRHFGALTAGDRADLRRVRRLAAMQLGAAAAAAAIADGAGWTLADAVALALSEPA